LTPGTPGILNSPASRTPGILEFTEFGIPGIPEYPASQTPEIPKSPVSQLKASWLKVSKTVRKTNPGYSTPRCPGYWRFLIPWRLGHREFATPQCPGHLGVVLKHE